MDELIHLANLDEFKNKVIKQLETDYYDKKEEPEPCLYMYAIKPGEEKPTVIVCPAGHLMTDDAGKRILANAIKPIIENLATQNVQVLYYMVVFEGWGVSLLKEEMKAEFAANPNLRPMNHPAREEKLLIHVEGERFQQMIVYKVVRGEEKNTIVFEEKTDRFDGAFANNLYKGEKKLDKNSNEFDFLK